MFLFRKLRRISLKNAMAYKIVYSPEASEIWIVYGKMYFPYLLIVIRLLVM